MFGLFKKAPQDISSSASPSWLNRLKAGLRGSRDKLQQGLSGLFGQKLDDLWFESLEETLILADVGVSTSRRLIHTLQQEARRRRIEEGEALKPLLKDELMALLHPLERSLSPPPTEGPQVILFVGVNGAGKTTSIGKLAQYFLNQDKKVLLAAGDTFRAAAVAQLVAWGERHDVPVITQEKGDSAAVIFDAIQAARARGIDIVLADTAGRLPTQLHLMEEIRKVKRVAAKADPTAPHEILLVLDANTGQNALTQVKAFDDALQLTGLIITKLDGTARGGVIAAIAGERPIPVCFLGVGEGAEDLAPFSASTYVDALIE
ncbi:signal recognition particle-docking protein FtsY [Ferrovum sp.]|uniref:signal recognition particle-docking protein FtsY n=1 Tax=Ferrovum sp. TaxID=2609467 RepID=UPI00261378F9|nr:signal recognition particle-docking protein FtsY [Ferrovum sp.]